MWLEDGIGDEPVQIVDRSSSWLDFLTSRYARELAKLQREYPKTTGFYIKYSDVLAYGKLGKEYVDRIDNSPDTVFEEIAEAIRQSHRTFTEHKEPIHARVTNVSRKRSIRSLRDSDVGTFVSIEGIIRKSTDTRPRCTLATFRCAVGHITRVQQSIGTLKEPERCSTYGCRERKLEFIESLSSFIDSQKLRIQESPEGLAGGEQPKSLDIELSDDLCGTVEPGDRIIINGILRRINRSQTQTKSTTFNLYLEGNSIERLESDFSEIVLTEVDEIQIRELAQDPGIFDKIAKSLAPAVFGMEDVKRAIALQLFGGVAHTVRKNRVRGDIHILLIGDPGIAKTQLLSYISQVAPRAIFTSGKGASAAGLTASAVKDDFGDGSWTLEAGALVLADRRICLVDEIGRMDKNDRAAMHEALEGAQQIHISKAGINATLHTRCPLLAAANPKYGRFDDDLGLSEQIDLEPPLISRFDLIFVLKDKPEKEHDTTIARHMLDSLVEDIISEPDISPELYRKYISLARKITPVLSVEARDILVEYYPLVRNIADNDKTKPLPMTARQLDAARRLSEACARVRLSETVTGDDAKRAIKILDNCLRTLAYDNGTGMFDVDVMMTGTKKETRDLSIIIEQMIKTISNDGKIEEYKIVEAVSKKLDIETYKVEKRIEIMKQSGKLREPKLGLLAVV